MSNRVIISASSDIGSALARSWRLAGHRVVGTYRTHGPMGEGLIHCDVSDPDSIASASQEIEAIFDRWDVLVLAPGTQDPVGPFADVSFDEWEASVKVNFTSQLRVVRRLLGSRNLDSALGPCVLFFAAGGTNNATLNYSAYTISKIALIKMAELLDAEIPDTKFTIIGPGWVRTKIHDATLTAGERGGANYQKTVDMLAGDTMVPMESVVECCDWVIGSERAVVGGRNISLAFDDWGDWRLDELLRGDPDMYKLRRNRNDVVATERTR